jgi:uncharacterized protein YkwD
MISSARRRGVFAALSAALLFGFFSVSSPTPANAGITSTERSVIKWINADREARGLRALRPWTTLYDIAEMRAKRMAAANVMSHTISGNLGSQLTGYGVRYYSKGENIAYTSMYTGLDAAKQIYRMWKGSSIHWAQMMSSKFNYVGVGLSYRSSNNRTYASLVFTESPDHTRPNAWITGASKSGHDITWSWRGTDIPLQTHTAGFRDFDVQYRVDLGSWRQGRDNTTATSLTMVDKSSGHTYGLRVRGRDRAGNVGVWSAETRVSLP